MVYWNSDTGARKQQILPNKGLADQFAARKTSELNSALLPSTDVIPISWVELLEKYRTHMEYDQCKPGAIKRRFLAIHTFAREMKITAPSHVTPERLERYIADGKNRVTRFGRPPAEATLYYDKVHLKAFIRWAMEERHLLGKFRLKIPKAPTWRAPKSLPAEDVARLLALFNDDRVVEFPDAWRTRLIIAVCTGQRNGVIEGLTPAKFTITVEDGVERGYLEVIEDKTGKPNWEPINTSLWPFVSAYIKSRPSMDRFWPDKYTSKKWKRICEAMGWPYPGFQYHDLRKVFASAMQAGGAPTGVTQKFLNHSTPNLTNQIYTHFDPAMKIFAEKLPGEDWARRIRPAKPTKTKETKPWRPRKEPRQEESSGPGFTGDDSAG